MKDGNNTYLWVQEKDSEYNKALRCSSKVAVVGSKVYDFTSSGKLAMFLNKHDFPSVDWALSQTRQMLFAVSMCHSLHLYVYIAILVVMVHRCYI